MIPEPYRVLKRRLPNGLRTFIVETPYLHTATVALYVRTGSRHENPKNNGLSHFLEHMLYRGSTGYRSSFELNSALEAEGGSLYAETSRDYSLFQVSTRPSGVPGVLRILGDLFTGPLLEDIESERQMILEEILEDLDDRGRLVNISDVARAKVWGDHPLGYPITGPARNVRRFSPSDLRAHFRRYFGARNLVLCVGGRVQRARVEKHVVEAFRGLSSGKAVQLRNVKPRMDGPSLCCVSSDAAQSNVQIHFHAVGAEHKDAAPLAMLIRMLDDGLATPLHYRVCDQKGLAYHVAADLETFHDASLFEIEAGCSPGKLSALMAEILSILDEFRREVPDTGALERVKKRYVEDLEAGYDDVVGLCGLVGGGALFSRQPLTPAERVRRMAAVTSAQVHRVAQTVFQRIGMTVTIVGKIDRKQVADVRRQLRRF